MDHPVPLPAGAVETAAPPARWDARTAGPVQAGKRLVGLILGIGAATPVALFVLLFLPLAPAPSARLRAARSPRPRVPRPPPPRPRRQPDS